MYAAPQHNQWGPHAGAGPGWQHMATPNQQTPWPGTPQHGQMYTPSVYSPTSGACAYQGYGGAQVTGQYAPTYEAACGRVPGMHASLDMH